MAEGGQRILFGLLLAWLAHDVDALYALAHASLARPRVRALRLQRDAWPARLARVWLRVYHVN